MARLQQKGDSCNGLIEYMSVFDKETKRNEFFEERDRELQELVDPMTGRVRDDFTERIVCRLCGHGEYRELFVKNGFSFVRCASCTLVYVNPQLKESAVLRYYGDELASNERALAFLFSPRQQETDHALYEEMFARIAPQIPGGRVLDIGCSFGLFLKTAKDRGYDVRGLELNKKAAAYGREVLGIPIAEKLLEECQFPDASFDLVSLFGVIEHLPRPVEVVQEIRRILRPGGMLIGRCPNVASLVCMILRADARTFTGRVHLSYFSEYTLARLLRDEIGFKEVSIDTFVSGKDSLLNYMQFLDPFGDETLKYLPEKFLKFLDDPARVAHIERAIEEWGLGYKLKFFATK